MYRKQPMEDESVYGKVYTTGNSFRGRAEAKQREFRVSILKAECDKYGHILSEESAALERTFFFQYAIKQLRNGTNRTKGLVKELSETCCPVRQCASTSSSL